MRQLLPTLEEDVDPVARYAADDRPTPIDRPWVLVNMITSVDGATAVAERSGGLGGPADREVFRALRELCDGILVGAATVRTENYRPVRMDEAARARRRGRAQQEVPRLVIVSGSADLDVEAPLFVEGVSASTTASASAIRPIVVTTERADARRREALAEVAEVLVMGADSVSMSDTLGALRAMGLRTVLCEGGPIVNAQLLAADLVDEWCQTISPLLVGGDSSRAAKSSGPTGDGPPQAMRLRRLLEQDGMLLADYVRAQ